MNLSVNFDWLAFNHTIMHNKLIQYSALALAFIAKNEETDAQITYTDFDPDLNVFNDEKFVYIDLNADGIDDVGFRENYVITSNSSYYNFELNILNENNIAVASDGPCSIVNSSSTYTCYISAMKFPYVFAAGDTLSLMQSWELEENVNQAFSCGEYGSYGGCVLGFFGYEINKQQFFGFKISSTDVYLCWLRLYWAGEYELMIDDCACTSNADAGLIIDTAIVSEINSSAFAQNTQVQFVNNQLTIQSISALNDAALNIINMSGSVLYSEMLNGNNFQIPVTVPAGIYIVQIKSVENLINKKIRIN